MNLVIPTKEQQQDYDTDHYSAGLPQEVIRLCNNPAINIGLDENGNLKSILERQDSIDTIHSLFCNRLTETLPSDYEDIKNEEQFLNQTRGGVKKLPYRIHSNELLKLLIDFPYAKMHIQTAYQTAQLLKHGNLTRIQQLRLAKIAFHTIAPLIRVYEIPSLIGLLESESMKVLAPKAWKDQMSIINKSCSNLHNISSKLAELNTQYSQLQIRMRIKSPWALYKKRWEGRSTDDVIGIEITLPDGQDNSTRIKQLIHELKQKNLIEYAYYADTFEDTFITKGKFNSNYKVVKGAVTISGTTVEVQFTTPEAREDNIRNHPEFKIINHGRSELGRQEDIAKYIGDYAQALLMRIKKGEKTSLSFRYEQTPEIIKGYSQYQLLRTMRGNHGLFIDFKGKSVNEILVQYINFFNPIVSYMADVIRIRNGRSIDLIWNGRSRNLIGQEPNPEDLKGSRIEILKHRVTSDGEVRLDPIITVHDILDAIRYENIELLNWALKQYPFLAPSINDKNVIEILENTKDDGIGQEYKDLISHLKDVTLLPEDFLEIYITNPDKLSSSRRKRTRKAIAVIAVDAIRSNDKYAQAQLIKHFPYLAKLQDKLSIDLTNIDLENIQDEEGKLIYKKIIEKLGEEL